LPLPFSRPGRSRSTRSTPRLDRLRTIPTSPFPSGGRNPLAEGVSPDYKNLYVVNNDDNNITQFGIGTDGKLYSQSTINTPGTFPMALAIDPVSSSGSSTSSIQGYLYVVDQLQPIAACTQTNPCPGAIAGYAIQSTTSTSDPGALGVGPSGCSATPTSTQTQCTNGNAVTNSNGLSYLPLQLSANDTTVLTPTAVAVTPNGSFAYVTAYNSSTSQGYLFTFAIASDGSLTAVNSGATYSYKSVTTAQIPASLGSEPTGIAADSAQAATLYVADKMLNQVSAYSVQSTGLLARSAPPPPAANPPPSRSQHRIHLRSQLARWHGQRLQLQLRHARHDRHLRRRQDPVAIIGDPRQLGFLYTVNFLGNSLSGFQVNQRPARSSIRRTRPIGIHRPAHCHQPEFRTAETRIDAADDDRSD
jgi:6-phosphogluconolactonase